MAHVRALALRAPGTNCDGETRHAFELAGATTESLHINRLLESPDALDAFQILCVPGGFSFGDDIAAGRIFASALRLRLGDKLQAFRDRGGLILGICNGFQVLLQTGLLVEPDDAGNPVATLALNRHGRFEDRWVHVKVTAGNCAFVRQDEILSLPVAHAEGNFIVSDQTVLERLDEGGRINARYVDADGNPGSFPVNPNGSMGDVAGISDATGRVFALMPHPERHVTYTQHPQWTRRKQQQPSEGDGLRVFRNAVNYFA